MRGEYLTSHLKVPLKQGSPPHAWGIQTLVDQYGKGTGITPTCVGNTKLEMSFKTASEDHPHMRGEYYPYQTFGTMFQGSPPHAWGIQFALKIFIN